MSRRPAWWPLPHVLRAGAESPFIDHHRPAATVGHLPQTADTVQPEVAATEDHLAVQLDAPDMCPPLGENLPASDGLCRRRLIALPVHEGREERPAIPWEVRVGLCLHGEHPPARPPSVTQGHAPELAWQKMRVRRRLERLLRHGHASPYLGAEDSIGRSVPDSVSSGPACGFDDLCTHPGVFITVRHDRSPRPSCEIRRYERLPGPERSRLVACRAG